MAEPVQFMFSLKEVAQALLKQQGISEGVWTLVIEFTFGAFSGGPDKDNILPSAAVGISRVGLAKAEKSGPLSFDAAELNPAGQKPVRTRKMTGSIPKAKIREAP